MIRAGTNAIRRPLSCLFGAMGFALAACASGPPPAFYVLGAMPPAATRTVPETGVPVVLVKPVMVPDYLDTTDLVVRDGGEVIPSRTGRWGERLSVGITRTLAAGLADRLPCMKVTAAQSPERPVRQVLVDVDAFEARTDGLIILTARWSIMDGAGRGPMLAERITLTVPLAGTGDAAIVAAMTRAVSDLADRIAAGVVFELLVRLDQLQPRSGGRGGFGGETSR